MAERADVYIPHEDLSWDVFRNCTDALFPQFNITSFRQNQLQALYSFVCGEEVFVSLPTGLGKSLIFQMAPLVHTWLAINFATNSNLSWKKEPILVIINPLVALMQDQLKKLSSLGLKAAYVGRNQDSSIQDIEQGKVTFVFVSAESTLASERWRCIFQ